MGFEKGNQIGKKQFNKHSIEQDKTIIFLGG